MNETLLAELSAQWQELLRSLESEVRLTDQVERAWMTPRLARIAECQRQLHDFFLRTGGGGLCSICGGSCCGCGRNHLTLVNLLGYLMAADPVPEPDFARPCPFLGDAGCRHGVERRPFNCVTFLCEEVEDRLDPDAKEAFYRAEGELRRLYGEFDRRYAGSSLRGIFIRAATLGGRPFLSRPEAV